jgi:hypothetical protein
VGGLGTRAGEKETMEVLEAESDTRLESMMETQGNIQENIASALYFWAWEFMQVLKSGVHCRVTEIW